jgi:hypothetical protein
VRILTISATTMRVSAQQEAVWPQLADAALHDARAGRTPAPMVWFRTDLGVSGVIPISPADPVRFDEVDKEPERFLGTVIALGPGAQPSD